MRFILRVLCAIGLLDLRSNDIDVLSSSFDKHRGSLWLKFLKLCWPPIFAITLFAATLTLALHFIIKDHVESFVQSHLSLLTAAIGVPVLGLLVTSVAGVRFARTLRRAVIIGRSKQLPSALEHLLENHPIAIQFLGSYAFKGETGPPPTLLGDTERNLESGEDINPIIDRGSASALEHDPLIRQVDFIVVAPSQNADPDDVNRVVDRLTEFPVVTIQLPSPDTATYSASLLLDATLPLSSKAPINRSIYHFCKRVFDILFSITAILLVSPVMLGIALAIKIQDRGPVLFRQVRVGKQGKTFVCFKFRSMALDAASRTEELRTANDQDGPVFKMRNDPRITPLGRFIRKYSLDELPQLFNVLIGDMTVVGPRPPVVQEHEGMRDSIARKRLQAKPGLTCIWQVYGRNRVTFQQWMEMDLFYIENASFWMDMKLILQTFPSVIRGTGM